VSWRTVAPAEFVFFVLARPAKRAQNRQLIVAFRQDNQQAQLVAATSRAAMRSPVAIRVFRL